MNGAPMTSGGVGGFRTVLGLVCMAGLLLGGPAAAGPAAESRDSRTLTKAEQMTFLPLACPNGVYEPMAGTHCSKLNGYAKAPGTVADFGLTSIAYGSFTKAGADQAYLSYFTMAEPHANNFGGGILFERSDSVWKLVRWYPGGQMDRCVALPGGGTQKMLCLSGYTAEGENSSAVAVQALPGAPDVLIRVEDARNEDASSSSGTSCGTVASYKERVISIDSMKHSVQPGFFAESVVTYVTPREWYDGCKARRLDNVKGEKATVRYALKNGHVTFQSPIPIEPPSP
jgi:hypothetical protein